jgi:hypothetical protein
MLTESQHVGGEGGGRKSQVPVQPELYSKPCIKKQKIEQKLAFSNTLNLILI